MKKLLAILLAIAMIMSVALVAGAEEVSYTAGLSYASSDWAVQTWGSDATCQISGPGTYTLSYDCAPNGAQVFVIDVGVEGGDAADVLSAYTLTELKVTVDGTEIPVDLEKVAVGNLEGKGRYRIEIYNAWGPTVDASPIDTNLLTGTTNLTVTFTLTDPNAPADENTGASLDCPGWWQAHTEGVEVTEDGIEVTATNVTYEAATANWNGPIWILYTGNEAKVNGDGYVEYWVQRGDNYGWCVVGQYYNVDLNRWSGDDALAAYGISVTDAFAEDFSWDTYLAELKAGAELKVSAKLDGSNVVITTEIAGVTNTTTLPVDTSKPVYLSLSGDLCTLSNIVVTENEPEPDPELPKTGDSIAVFVALLVASAMGIAIVSKKKF